MICWLSLSLAVVAAFGVTVQGHADGAPSNEDICKSLTPKHGDLIPQASPVPYEFSLSKTEVKGGESVTVKIMKKDGGAQMKGFMMQARMTGSMTPAGKFTPVAEISKGMKCSDMENSSLTHANNMGRDSVEAEWIAPAAPGTYEILHTVVKDGATFWVAVKSKPITVN